MPQNIVKKKEQANKAMLFAAGLGSRLKPFTDKHPKALAMVNGQSLLERNIKYLQQHGIFEVIVNLHHFADQIVDTIEKNKGWGSSITISDESSEVLETGGGLKKAGWYFANETFFVIMNVDILTNMNLTAMMQQHSQSATLATLAVSIRESSRYFLFDKEGNLAGWKNQKTGEEKIVKQTTELIPKAFSGIHVVNGTLPGLIKQEGKFSMVDVYLDLAKSNAIRAFDHTGAQLLDVGKPESIVKAETIFL